jgi:hypothetical protein
MSRKDDDHRAEMSARKLRRQAREQRSWQEGPTPSRAKERAETTDVVFRRKTAQRSQRRALRRLSDAAATAEGKIWRNDDRP